jgi:arylsulfatase A-like enzyme
MEKKPNIVFLLNDHMAFYGHGKMSGGPKILRPSFEKLATEGIEFTRAYTACPLCAPARRTMLTGLFPHNHGEINNVSYYPFDRETYLSILAKNGYRNYYYGKWHSGPGTAHNHHCEGFSYPSFSNPYTKPEYKVYIKKRNLPHFQVRIDHLFMNPNGINAKKLGLKIGELVRPNGNALGEPALGTMITPKETHEAFFLADIACNKLREIVNDDKMQPFHLRVDFWGPHHPYYASQEFLDLYDPGSIPVHPNFYDDLKSKPNIYQRELNYPLNVNGKLIQPNPLSWSEWQKILVFNYAQQTLMDEAGGLILKELEDLGLSENTFVIWTADHGDAVASHGGHFDKESYMPEEMMRIPLSIRYPDLIQAGQKCEKLVSNLDLAPTILEAADLAFNDPVDGQSLLHLCVDSNINWREDLMSETHGHFAAHLGRLIVTERYKYIYNDGDMDELYDLEEDPYELMNFINNNLYKDVLAEMKKRLEDWRQKTGDKVSRKMIRRYGLKNPKF